MAFGKNVNNDYARDDEERTRRPRANFGHFREGLVSATKAYIPSGGARRGLNPQGWNGIRHYDEAPVDPQVVRFPK